MLGLTALELGRIQFGFTISFHIIFPAITIGLGSYLAVLEGLWLWKKEPAYRDLYHFWSKIFAVNFVMGVVSGLVMAFQFGTNWSYFSAFAGSVTGPLLAYEVLTAFFLEAGFLGVMLFGWNKVGPGLHFFATVTVAIGLALSAFGRRSPIQTLPLVGSACRTFFSSRPCRSSCWRQPGPYSECLTASLRPHHSRWHSCCCSSATAVSRSAFGRISCRRASPSAKRRRPHRA
jgi:hypothetical protein